VDVYYNGKTLDDNWLRELNGIAIRVAGSARVFANSKVVKKLLQLVMIFL
jgi:hypothetical protein